MRSFLIPVLFCLISCVNPTSADENYYFPVKDFFTEKTYCFINQNDTRDKSYWKMKTCISSNDTFLLTVIFDGKKRITDSITEKICSGNSKIISYTLFDYDEQGNKISSESEILDSLLFISSQKKGESIKWKLRFKDYRSSNTCELSKIRTLKSNDQNQKIFRDYLKFEVIGTAQGYQYEATMVYQKNKGLISYKMILPDGKEKDYVLTSIK